jgi:hypothetical protein
VPHPTAHCAEFSKSHVFSKQQKAAR